MSELERLSAELDKLRAEIDELKYGSPFAIATIASVDNDTNAVSLRLEDGTETTAGDQIALSGYTPVTGHRVLLAKNGADHVVLSAPGAPIGQASQVEDVAVEGGIGSLIISWTPSTDPTVANGKGYYQVQLAEDVAFTSILYDVEIAAATAILGSGLLTGTGYWARVRAIDAYKTLGDWSLPATGAPVAITETQIADDSVSTPKLQANSVIADKLAANSVIADKIAAASIDASKLQALQLSVGQWVKSAGFVEGVAGWKIDADGTAEFNDVIARGQIEAGNIYSSQVTTVEGVNLLENPGFETDISGWTTGAVFERDTGQKHSGAASGKFTTGGVGLSRLLLEGSSFILEENSVDKLLLEGFALENYILFDAVPCVAGATYEARAWYRYNGAATNFNAYAGIEFFDAEGAQIGSVHIGAPFYPGVDTWAQVSSGAHVAPANAFSMAIRASIFNFNASEFCWVDDLELFRTSSFVGSLETSAAPNLPRVSIVDNDTTLGPSIKIGDGRDAETSLSLTSPEGLPTSVLRGGAYDSNIPSIALIGGDGAGGDSSIIFTADSIVGLQSFLPGMEMDWPARTAPPDWLMEYGQAVSRSTYSDLFDVLVPVIGTPTISIASPGVVTLAAHGFFDGDAVYLTTTGALPTGLAQNTLYYVKYVSSSTFQLSASRTSTGAASTAINTSGTQSGTHTIRHCPYGLGDGSTTFNVPDSRGVVNAGLDNMGGSDRGLLSIANALGFKYGTQDHALVIAELAQHYHTQTTHYHNINNLAWVANSSANILAVDGGNPTQAHPTSWSGGDNTGNTGSGTAHNTMQPTRLGYKIIKT